MRARSHVTFRGCCPTGAIPSATSRHATSYGTGCSASLINWRTTVAKWPYNTQAWQTLRKVKLQRDPLCEDCNDAGTLRVACVVDHKHAISQGGDPFPALDGLASLCAACHNAKTARGGEAGAARTAKPRKGCSPDGLPLDRRHPWAKRKRIDRTDRLKR